MPESKNSQEKESRLPTVVPAARTPSTQVSKKTGIFSVLAIFAPLAVEVIYGFTRKWLAETTISRPVSQTTDKRKTVSKVDSQSFGTAGFRRRYRGNLN